MTLRLLLLALPLFLTPARAQAQSCSVSAEAVLFNSYDTLSGLPSDGVGAVRVTCDGAYELSVGLSSGRGVSGMRAMHNGAYQLEYELYADPSRLVPWGDGGSAGKRSAIGPDARLTVYGRIRPNQNVPAGEYNDVVMVVVSF